MPQHRKFVTAWDTLGGLVPLLGLAPMLYFAFTASWEQPHMRFFPIAILAAFLLAIRHKRYETTHPVRWWAAMGILWISLLVYVLAVCNFSTSLAQLAGAGVFCAWGLGSCGNARWTAIACWTGLLLTTIPLPGAADTNLIAWFESAGSSGCSMALDTLGISNFNSSHAIQVQGVVFQNDDIFSGYGSLRAFFAVAVVLLCFSKCSLVVAIFSLATVPLWHLTCEFWRVLTIALAMEYFNRDIAHGLDHTMLSVFTFLLGIGCFWLSSRLLAMLLHHVPVAESEFSTIFEGYNRILAWPQAVPAEAPPQDEEEKRQFELLQKALEARKWKWPELKWTDGLLLPRSALAVSLLTACIGCIPATLIAKSLMAPRPKLSEVKSRESWVEESLPAEVANWKRVTFVSADRETSGQAAATWQYLWPDQQLGVTVSIEPDDSKPIEGRYLINGWEVENRVATADASHTQWPCDELEIKNDLGGTAYVLWSGASEPPSNNEEQTGSALGIVTAFRDLTQDAKSPTSRVLLFCESGEKLSEANLKILRSQFFQLRTLLANAQHTPPDTPPEQNSPEQNADSNTGVQPNTGTE